MKRKLRSIYRHFRQFPPVAFIMAIFRCVTPLPLSHVEIETTTVCTRRCSYCPNSIMPRPQKFMEEKTFYKIIDDLKKAGFAGTVSPHFYGEPLCDTRLEAFVRYAKDKLPNCNVQLFTNGDLLDHERFKSLRNAGVDTFTVSKHDKVLRENIAGLKARYPDIIEIKDYHSDNALLMNRGGILNIPKKMSKGCYFMTYLINQMTIDYLGNVILCCNDYGSSVILGNVNEENIKTIWERHRFRRAFIMNGFWKYPICKRC